MLTCAKCRHRNSKIGNPACMLCTLSIDYWKARDELAPHVRIEMLACNIRDGLNAVLEEEEQNNG